MTVTLSHALALIHVQIVPSADTAKSNPVEPTQIIYRYNSETLAVYRILHQRQDIDTYAMIDL